VSAGCEGRLCKLLSCYLPAPPPGGGGLASIVSVFTFSQWLRLAFFLRAHPPSDSSYDACNTIQILRLSPLSAGWVFPCPGLRHPIVAGGPVTAWVGTALAFTSGAWLGGGGSGTVTCPLELAHPVHLHDLGALSLVPCFLSFVLPMLMGGGLSASWCENR
jgi:hypothetical protein